MSYWKFGSRYAGITSRGKRFVVDTRAKALQKVGKGGGSRTPSKSKTRKKRNPGGGSVANQKRRRKFTIPISIVGPLIGTGAWAYYSHDQNEARIRHYINAYVPGFDPNVPWNHRLQYGLYPLIIGALVHKIVGGIMGVNRMLGRAGVPVFRL